MEKHGLFALVASFFRVVLVLVPSRDSYAQLLKHKSLSHFFYLPTIHTMVAVAYV
jgi:hypothetical protein